MAVRVRVHFFRRCFYLLCDLPLILFQYLTLDGYLGPRRSRLNGNSGISAYLIEKRNAVRDHSHVRSGQVRRGRINALCMLVESLKNRLRKSSNAIELTKSRVHGICT